MKNLLLPLFSFLSIINTALCQKITILSTGDDQNNTIEANMAIVGFSDSASLGLDPQLGEIQINEINSIYNIYAIQREKNETECSFSKDSVKIFFDENLSLNKDIRNNNNFNNFFQIKNKSDQVKMVAVIDENDRPLNETLNSVSVVRNCQSDSSFLIQHFGTNSIQGLDFSIITFESKGNINGLISSIIIEFKDNLVDIPILDKSELQIYPNPVKNEFMISNFESIDILRIINSIGQPVLEITELNSNTVNVSHLQNGIYNIILRRKNGTIINSKVFKI